MSGETCNCCQNKTSTINCSESNAHLDKIKFCFPDLSFENYSVFKLCSICSDLLESSYSLKQKLISGPFKYLNVTFSAKNVLETDEIVSPVNKTKPKINYRRIKPTERSYEYAHRLCDASEATDQAVLEIHSVTDEESEDSDIVCEFNEEENRREFESNVSKSVPVSFDNAIFESKSTEETNAAVQLLQLFESKKCQENKNEPAPILVLEHSYSSFPSYSEHSYASSEAGKKSEQIKKFRCSICQQIFENRDVFHLHLNSHSEIKNSRAHFKSQIKLVKCTVNQNAQNEEKKSVDMQQKENISANKSVPENDENVNVKFSCNKCQKIFQTVEELKVHYETEYQLSIKCKQCFVKFASKDELLIHEAFAHPKKYEEKEHKEYKCKSCDQVFYQNTTLLIHERIHSEEKPFLCYFCGKSFKEQGHLLTHFKEHRQAKRYKCDHCDKAYIKWKELAKHEATKHPEVPRPFHCNQCSFTFREKRALEHHYKDHERHGQRPFPCQHCPKKFSTAAVCRTHERIHTGDKPLKCKFCSQSFRDWSNLRSHTFRHTGEKPYKCPECGTRCRTSSALLVHKRRHTGERPYPCGHCDMRFAVRAAMLRHERNRHDDGGHDDAAQPAPQECAAPVP